MADDWRNDPGPSNAEKMKKGFQNALNKSKRDFERTQNRLGIYGLSKFLDRTVSWTVRRTVRRTVNRSWKKNREIKKLCHLYKILS